MNNTNQNQSLAEMSEFSRLTVPITSQLLNFPSFFLSLSLFFECRSHGSRSERCRTTAQSVRAWKQCVAHTRRRKGKGMYPTHYVILPTDGPKFQQLGLPTWFMRMLRLLW